MRAERPALLVVDSGGLVESRVAVSTLDSLEIQVESLDKMAYDAVNIAERDFHQLKALRHTPTTPFVSANLLHPEELPFPVKPFVATERGGQKIAIVGLFLGESAFFADANKTLKKILPQMRKQADIIVLLAYGSHEDARKIMDEYPEIRVAVSNSASNSPNVEAWNGRLLVSPAVRSTALRGGVLTLRGTPAPDAQNEISVELSKEISPNQGVEELILTRERELFDARQLREQRKHAQDLRLTPEEFMRKFSEQQQP